MKRKKILFVYYKLFKPGGIARVLSNLANELVSENDVSILLLMDEHTPFYELDERVNLYFTDSFAHWAFRKVNVNLDKYFKWLPYRKNLKNYSYDFGAWQTLSDWIKIHSGEFDLIIGCQYKVSIQLAKNSRCNYKTIAWEHTDHQVGGMFFSTLRRKNYYRLKGIITVNSSALKYYKQLNPNTRWIPNIIGSPFEEQTFHPEKEKLISYVGRLDKDKNVSELLEIFLEADLEKSWKLQIIGDGPERSQLEGFIEKNKLGNRVSLLGNKTPDEVTELLLKSSVFGFTSLKEAMGMVLVEALFCGNVLIAYDCESGPSDIVNSNNGFLIPLKDKETFVKTLKAIVSDEDRLKEMSRSAFEDAKNWKKELLISKWTEIIETPDSETEGLK